MADIKPFKINVPDTSLAKLKQKLELTRFPEGELEEAGWDYGAPLQEIKDLTQYWLTKFSWRAAETKLNTIPQFITSIKVENFDPIDIHFMHQRSDVPGAIPLLFLHGWPGSFIEVTKLLPLLKGEDGKQAFHVVAPSLPNYGFSGRVTKKGFGLGQYAEAVNNLMGDWGGLIVRVIGARYPQHNKASHINLAMASEPKWDSENPKPEDTAREIATMKASEEWLKSGNGYWGIQSTKPAPLSFSLSDSPTGLLAWIYEKLIAWTDAYPWTPDEILIWISIYYFSTAGPGASIYTYYEATHDQVFSFPFIQEYVDVPLAIADFPKEGLGPVVEDVDIERGGHFAAWERPEDLAGCLVRVFGKGGGAEGVVKGL
ncbi:Alpha/Beta hydrolase protein [Leptodontidium sp. MPI-SDFR-AT-0119]|nr:Alpha/Beta hydrolase protein [Leptodontidium sp. MPI-SDFR-AT-0119]